MMKKRTFLSSLLALPALGFLPKATAATEKNLPELAPVPNTDKFGIEVLVYPYTGDFLYLAPSIPVTRKWMESFIVPTTSKNDLPDDFVGYCLNRNFLSDEYWDFPTATNRCSNDVWGQLGAYHRYKVQCGNRVLIRDEFVKIHVGFMDCAAPAYNDTPEQRKWFWDTQKTIYLPYTA